MINIGFVVLSYNEPLQVLRLTETLTKMFDAPSILVHHNFNQSDLDTHLFPINVRFVAPYTDTGWGSIEIAR